MPPIQLQTPIAAPPELVFDLARSIDAHLASSPGTGERAVDGKTTGLAELGDTITWQARHLGLRWRLTVAVTEFDRPHRFVDEQTRGPFAEMRHEHLFESKPDDSTLMRDHFHFRAPCGLLGRLAERLILRRHLAHFLRRRNAVLKTMAEDR